MLLGATVVATGCFPSPVAVDTQNTPPVIQRGGTTRPDPNDVTTIQQSSDPQNPVETLVLINVVDPDPETVIARFFIDPHLPPNYEVPAPSLPDRPIPPSVTGDPSRLLAFTMRGFCDGRDLGVHDIEVYVTDTGFVDAGDDLRVTTREPNSNRKGGRDGLRWRINCVLPGG